MKTGKRPINVACHKNFNNGVLPVDLAYVFKNGLAVHRCIGGFRDGRTEYLEGWTITHLSSGMSMGSWDYGLKRHAVAVVRMMSELTAINDFAFGIPFGDVSGHPEQIKALYDVVKLARQKLTDANIIR